MISIAIDDEALALQVIETYSEKVPHLSLIKTFRNAVSALDFINSEKIDLVFLDINMPDLNGFQFVKAMSPVANPMIIFTTAYSKYAFESYNYQTIDYLLKPIEFERFLKSVNKAQEIYTLRQQLDKNSDELPRNLFIKSGSKFHKVNIDELLYLEGKGNYISFQLRDKKILSLYTMQKLKDLLPSNFVRVHKSFIINTHFIESIDSTAITINNNDIPIGNIYKEEIKVLMDMLIKKIGN